MIGERGLTYLEKVVTGQGPLPRHPHTETRWKEKEEINDAISAHVPVLDI